MLAVLKDDLRAATPPTENAAEPSLTQLKGILQTALYELLADYAAADRGMEIRQVAGGYRMSTKPEHHDVVRAFARSLKPPVRLSLPALETLAVIAYKQPITVPEINEIRGVDSSGVIATLLDRKLITTAGRKQVIGRPILYRTTKDFLLRFGLGDIGELPSMEEFEKLAAASLQGDLFQPGKAAVPDATGVPDIPPETANYEPAPDTEHRTTIELGEPRGAEVTAADS
jgi:segregation and condensation protein B